MSSSITALASSASEQHAGSRLPSDGKTLADFVRQGLGASSCAGGALLTSAAAAATARAASRTAFIESYGCQMNVNDSEVSVQPWARHAHTLQPRCRSEQRRFGVAPGAATPWRQQPPWCHCHAYALSHGCCRW